MFFYLHQGGYICFFVCQQGYENHCWPDFHYTFWKGVSWAKEEAIQFWSGSGSRGRCTNYLSLLLTLWDRAWPRRNSALSEFPFISFMIWIALTEDAGMADAVCCCCYCGHIIVLSSFVYLPLFRAVQYLHNHFNMNQKCQPAGGTRWKVSRSAK